MSIKKIVIIGSGNVATALGKKLYELGYLITQVYSRKLKNAESLAKNIDAKAISDLSSIDLDADLYIVAISDNAIEKVVKQIQLFDKLIVHTSGSTSINILKECSKNIGVLYPLQTFTKKENVNWEEINICIEANNKSNQDKLTQLVNVIGAKSKFLNSNQRLSLHLSAVFAGNFTNYMLTLANQICDKHDVDYELLSPLIEEVFAKNKITPPEYNQTGPARRNDSITIQKHLDLLKNQGALKDLYEMITDQIIKKYNY